MRIVCISDTHTHHRDIKNLPAGDVLVHAGDISYTGKFKEIYQFNEWIGTLDYKNKIVIAGNHELGFDKRHPTENAGILNNCTYLQDSAVTINKVKFYGAPWTPRFCDWAFNVDRDEIWKYWYRIHKDTDVLVTHGPPWGIEDYVEFSNEHVGCQALKDRMDLLSNLKVHIFGHVHSQYGKYIDDMGRIYVNAAVCDEEYKVTREPIVVDL